MPRAPHVVSCTHGTVNNYFTSFREMSLGTAPKRQRIAKTLTLPPEVLAFLRAEAEQRFGGNESAAAESMLRERMDKCARPFCSVGQHAHRVKTIAARLWHAVTPVPGLELWYPEARLAVEAWSTYPRDPLASAVRTATTLAEIGAAEYWVVVPDELGAQEFARFSGYVRHMPIPSRVLRLAEFGAQKSPAG